MTTANDTVAPSASSSSGLLGKLGALHDRVFAAIQSASDGGIELLARVVFLLVLAPYFLGSAMTKIGSGFPGIFVPQDGAYIQIVPHLMEQAGYDASQIGLMGDLIVLAGTYGEFLLPVLLIVGLFTRIAALGMVVFVLVQSYVDIVLHAVDPNTIGAWLDRTSGSVILDQRAFWVFLLLSLVVRGGGWLSADRLIGRK